MAVTLTSPAFGLDVGDTYTGPEEAWLLSQGYASQDGYTGPGVSNTGATDVDPGDDPTLASNREDQPWLHSDVEGREGRLDPAIVEGAGGTADPIYPAYDFDPAGADTGDVPSVVGLEPETGAAAGGDVVTISGQNLTDVTGVTFGGVAATGLTVVSDDEIEVTTPAVAAGAADVVVTNANGADTVTGGFTFA